jgi:hypothetical protein
MKYFVKDSRMFRSPTGLLALQSIDFNNFERYEIGAWFAFQYDSLYYSQNTHEKMSELSPISNLL